MAYKTFTTRAQAPGMNAGGGTDRNAVVQVTPWTALDRFLMLGTEGSTFYASAQELTRQNAKNLQYCIEQDGLRVVSRIVEVSDRGLAVKNDPALFALMLCTVATDVRVRKAAWAALPKVARTGTHLLHAVAFREQFGGWGRAARKGIAAWFNDKTTDSVGFQVVKYPQRDGWSMRDVFRVSHPHAITSDRNALYKYITHGLDEFDSVAALNELPNIVRAAELAKGAASRDEVIRYIRDYRLPWEAVPNQFLGADNKANAPVWEAILETMPAGAMLRQLPTLTRVGLLDNFSAATRKVADTLTDPDTLRKARLHPLSILSAMRTYAGGMSLRGSATWTPVRRIVDVLDDAFYASFGFIEPTGKRYMLALDISGSMTYGQIAGLNLTPREVSAAMAMATARVESDYEIVGFSHSLVTLAISPRQRLDDVIKTIERYPFGSTNCSAPFEYALKNGKSYDIFTVYTDNETNSHRRAPREALREYRTMVNPAAKLAVVGLTANNISIADPNDPGMLDFVGGDASLPQALTTFANLDLGIADATPVAALPKTQELTGKRRLLATSLGRD